MIYVDSLRPCLRNKNWRYDTSCHLIADTKAELIQFAERIGLRVAWYQRTAIPHFDLTAGKRIQAVHAGAIEIAGELHRHKRAEIREKVQKGEW